MENIKLLRTLYRQLEIHSNEWSEELSGVNFLIHETHKISGCPRKEVVHLFHVLEEMKILELKTKDPLTYRISPIPLIELEKKLSKGSVASYQMNDLFEVLDMIEYKPGLFLLEARLDYLYVFLSGYKMAANLNNELFSNIEQLDKFSEFLFTQFDEASENTMLWFGILSNEFDANEKGLEKFFEYMWKYRLSDKMDS